jgi:hypothetical protein
MQPREPGAKDPTVAVVLSLFFPGLGHLYAGKAGPFVVFLALELWLVSHGRVVPLLMVHVFQAIAAGGAAKLVNAANAAASQVAVPPPPTRGSRRPAAPGPTDEDGEDDDAPPVNVPPAPPVPPALPAVLDADAFLFELRAAWQDHRTSAITARQFADRKWRAIRAVRVEQADEGEALVAAAHELAAAGVLTSEEIGQLEARVKA